MTRLKVTLTLLFCALNTLTFAQNVDSTIQTMYETRTIYLKSASEYVKHGRLYKVGLFKGKLKKEFAVATDQTKNELNTSIKQSKTAAFCAIVSSCIFVTALVTIPASSAILTNSLFLTSALIYLPTIICGQKSFEHLNKSIWLLNRDNLNIK